MNKQENDIRKNFFKKAGQIWIENIREAEKVDRQKIDLSLLDLKNRRLAQRRQRRLSIYAISVAASLLIAAFSISFFYTPASSDWDRLAKTMWNDSVPHHTGEITLITQSDRMKLSNEASLEYKKNGQLQVNKENVIKETAARNQQKFNHIIVPKGKRATITFSDGTSMYINSGSHVIYPSEFEKNKREILVEGEVYLEVAKDPERPFFVKTKNFDVKVLGTTFNVSAYKDDETATVVLVEGKVEVDNNQLKTTIRPNEMISISNGTSTVTHVDVSEYISWKDYIMLLAEHRAGDVFTRLSRYYGIPIEYEQALASYPVSGKLDLRSGIYNSLDILTELLDIKYETTPDGNIRIYK